MESESKESCILYNFEIQSRNKLRRSFIKNMLPMNSFSLLKTCLRDTI